MSSVPVFVRPLAPDSPAEEKVKTILAMVCMVTDGPTEAIALLHAMKRLLVRDIRKLPVPLSRELEKEAEELASSIVDQMDAKQAAELRAKN